MKKFVVNGFADASLLRAELQGLNRRIRELRSFKLEIRF